MNFLVIGGTIFVGRHFIEAALARGHAVSLFHRGKHSPDLFPDVPRFLGDRTKEDDVANLVRQLAENGQHFDAIVDTCGYFPRAVRLTAERLVPFADAYCFISSISVYADFAQASLDEAAPVGTLADETVEQVTGETYGPLKALCEQAVEAAFPGRTLNVRPGLIVGPHDPTDRFTYWPHRVAQGGRILAPESPGVPTQFIDARDLAEWTVRMLERNKTGIYNATGPDYDLTLGDVLETCRAESGSDAEFVWAAAEVLKQHEVAPWSELPLWVPTEGDTAGLNRVSVAKAAADGLTFRSLSQTVHDTLVWDRTRPQESSFRATLAPEKEQAVLAAMSD